MELVHGGAGEVRQSEVIAALSHALDMTEGHPVGQAERTCLIGMRIAHELQLDEESRYALYYALLLKDVGCSSSAARMCELFGTDDIALKTHGKLVDWTKPRAGRALHLAARRGRWPHRARPAHALGAALAGGRGQGDRRDALRPRRRDRPEPRIPGGERRGRAARSTSTGTARAAVGPAGRRDPAPGAHRLPQSDRRGVLRDARRRRGARDGARAPRALVRPAGRRRPARDRARRPAVERPACATTSPRRCSPLEPADRVLVLDEAGIDRVCEAFADVIDAKSPFTARHSRGVATYAGLIGGQLGFGPAQLRELHRAGLLHDIGKLGIPNTILDKPAKLTDDEFARIRLHPAYTESILAGIPAFAALRRGRRGPPRAPGRPRLPPRRARRRPPGERARPGGRRRLRGAHRRPPVPQPDGSRGGARDRARAIPATSTSPASRRSPPASSVPPSASPLSPSRTGYGSWQL